MPTLIKTLTLELGDQTVHCQLSKAQLTDSPTSSEEVTTFCGTETSSDPKYTLTLGGFQDWGTATAVCDLIHQAYIADPVEELDFVITVGTTTRTGKCKPTNDVPYGGDAGASLKFEVPLEVIGKPVDGVVTAAPADGGAA
jgi:hypothetical protein